MTETTSAKSAWPYVAVAGIAAGFGAFCVYMGHNGAVVPSVFTILGTIAGYIFGKVS